MLLAASAGCLYLEWEPGFLEARWPATDAAGRVFRTDLPHELTVSTTGRYFGIDRQTSVEIRSGTDLSLLHEFQVEDVDKPCWVTFSKDERWAAVCTGENVHVMDMDANANTSWRCEKMEYSLYSWFYPQLHFSPTGRYLVYDGGEIFALYDPATGATLLTVNEPILSLAPENSAPTEPRAQAAAKETDLDGFARQLATPAGMTKQGVGIRPLVSLDRGRMVTVCGGMVQVWDIESRKRIACYPKPPKSFRRALSADGERVLWEEYGDEQVICDVRDVMTDEIVMRTEPGPRIWVFTNPFRFSRNNRRCLAPYPSSKEPPQDGLCVMDLPSGRSWCLPSRIYLDSTHDGAQVLSMDPSEDPGRIELRDAETGEALYRFDTPTNASPLDACSQFAIWPDGRRFAIVSFDGIVDVWRYRRPDRWWGVFWLPAFWTTVFFAALMLRCAFTRTRTSPTGSDEPTPPTGRR